MLLSLLIYSYSSGVFSSRGNRLSSRLLEFIKEAIGFRRFSLRGEGKVALEWTLVCVFYNLRRLHRLVTIKTQNITPACA
jgi:hypothetical protein